MQFRRINNTSFFEPTLGNNGFVKLFLYHPTQISQIVNFDDHFLDTSSNFILCLVKEDDNFQSIKTENLDRIFSGSVFTGCILWLDDCQSINDPDYFIRRRYIGVKKRLIISEPRLHPVLSAANSTPYIFRLTGFKDKQISISGDIIRLNSCENILLKVNLGSAVLNDVTIDLRNGFHTKGALLMQSIFDLANKSAFAVKLGYISLKKLNADEDEALVTYDLIGRENLDQASLNAIYFPFEDIQRKDQSYHSNFQITKHGAITNFANQKGNNYHLHPSTPSLNLHFSRIRMSKTEPGLDKILLRPLGKTVIENQDRTRILLLGNSGTESIKHEGPGLGIEFTDSTQLVVDEKNLKMAKHGPGGQATFIKINESCTYHLDAEKSPLFDNNPGGNDRRGTDQKVEIPYKPIPVSTKSTRNELPFIPMLSFNGDESLREFEKVFSKLRLTENMAAGSSPIVPGNYVTPQGFLRNGNDLCFIKENKQETDQSFFTIKNVMPRSDFNLSISNQDVFFVITPDMMAGKIEEINILFKINGFSIDLRKFVSPIVDYDHCPYLIFKFGQSKFMDLLNNPTKWSNYQSYNPADIAKLREALWAKIKFPNTVDYTYINNIVNNGHDWNGVILLNVRLNNGIPPIFRGLSASQTTATPATTPQTSTDPLAKIVFKTALRFQYIAFPINRTTVDQGSVDIRSSSFYGVIDYDLLNKPGSTELSDDYETVSAYFPDDRSKIDTYKLLLTKLLVRFENSEIRNFQSTAFLQIPQLFDSGVEFDEIALSHDKEPGRKEKPNCIRLDGSYQKNSAGEDEFNFVTQENLVIRFNDGNLLKNVTVSRVGFGISDGSTDEYRFDIEANAAPGSWLRQDLFSMDELSFQNIGLKFKTDIVILPKIEFDLSRLLVFPKFSFNGKGLLRSFPLRFSHFDVFKLAKVSNSDIHINYDFFTFPGFGMPDISVGAVSNLFSFIFDFDLGTLGNLEALKALKGKLCIGWAPKGGFAIGMRLDGPSTGGLDLNLFGAIKLHIHRLELCQIKEQFVIRVLDARLKIFSVELPPSQNTFSAVIFAKPGENTAWLISYTDGENTDPRKNKLLLGVGQRVGTAGIEQMRFVQDGIEQIKEIFDPHTKICEATDLPPFYQRERNWLIGSEAILDDDLPLEIQFIFNDPVFYGLHLGFKNGLLKGFGIDILYKRIAENLGVYSAEIQLPDSFRSYDTGGAYFRLPNIGIDIFTNGDWRADVGFPRNSDDWSRSGFLQLRTAPPFVGWFGFYIMRSKMASLTLFKEYISDSYSQENLKIVQAGFAMRVGLGAYIDGGIFYVGASITLYGILEGAFAFETQGGLAKMFPDHFAVFGRVGAIAELVGYVDFFIIKASIRISLRTEFGLLLVYLSKPGNIVNAENNPNQSTGIQPVKVYVEGRVTVEVSVKIGCVRIHLSFQASVRFEYTIGGGSSSQQTARKLGRNLSHRLLAAAPANIEITSIRNVPVVYIPTFSKVKENGTEKLLLIHSFSIPFFGKGKDTTERIQFSDNNLFKNTIIRPFFQDLVTGLKALNAANPSSYETLRAVLIGDEVITKSGASLKVKIKLPNYTPTLIKGINSEDKNVISKILTEYFLFAEGEMIPCAGSSCSPIVEAYKDLMNVVPVPMRSKISIASADTAFPHEIHDDFTLTVKGLATTENGLSDKCSVTIEPVNKSNSALEYMQAFYDDYRTQFLDRRKQSLSRLAENELDVRSEVMIPEFFKLIALLTLEAFFNEINPKRHKGKSVNPQVEVDGTGKFIYAYEMENERGNMITHRDEWNPNGSLNDIVGQLNYFYNSGLRLPEVAEDPTTTAIYSVLGQQTPISPLVSGSPDPTQVKVTIDNTDITSEVFGEGEARRKTNIASTAAFISLFRGTEFLRKLANEFEAAPNFLKPFNLTPVTLAVQTSRLYLHDDELRPLGRFFELPNKLSGHGDLSSRYSFAVNYADNEGKSSSPLQASICLNVEVRIKRHTKRVIEIVNVFAHDQNLLNILRRDSITIKEIELYYKPTVNDNNQPINLLKIVDKTATLLKTNLSPRTSPPLFEDIPALRARAATNGKFWEDSDKDRNNFVELLSEAVTTNTGGYFIVLDKDFNGAGTGNVHTPEETVIFSFSADGAGIPHYFNCFKLKYDEELFEGLDNKTHYLYLNEIKLGDKPVKEYHPVIPAHAFGFNILRDRSKNPSPSYEHYLPLEFSLREVGGPALLDREHVLPIMPTNQRVGDAMVPNHLEYQHISPLRIMDRTIPLHKVEELAAEANNVRRYETVGKDYELEYNLRDVYGYRTSAHNEPLRVAKYTHFYLDKLVPVEAWPMVKLSYWLAGWKQSSKTLTWSVSCHSDIREVLDIAGVERIGNNYKYSPGQVIEKSDADKLLDVIPGLLDSLYTILAQLTDVKTTVTLKQYVDQSTRPVKEELRKKIASVISLLQKLGTASSDGSYRMVSDQVIKTTPFLVETVQSNSIKNVLDISIDIERHEANTLATEKASALFGYDAEELNGNHIWEFSTTRSSSSPIALLNPTNASQSSVSDLNNAIRLATCIKCPAGNPDKVVLANFSLGISLDNIRKERVLFVLNEVGLSGIKANHADNEGKFSEEKCHFGIKPFSNKLWSGRYIPGVGNLPTQNFSGVDLDKSLRIVLEKMDSLLQPDFISQQLNVGRDLEKVLFDGLISSKKALAKSYLQRKLDWVMSERVVSDEMRKDFLDLLLEKPTNFYDYDGIVGTSVTSNIDLTGHRLTISLENQPGYRLLSSKIDDSSNWFIHFDRQEQISGDISFNIKPKITHIEYDISTDPHNQDRQFSTWIQLLTPVEPESTYKVSNWKNIVREFPEKPVIVKHAANQRFTDGHPQVSKWDASKHGRWFYNLQVIDAYKVGDLLRGNILFSRQMISRLQTAGNFNGFIAYWASRITDPRGVFEWDKFVDDLRSQFNDVAAHSITAHGTAPKYAFELKKVAENKWDIIDKHAIPGVTISFVDPTGKEPDIEIGDFNIFTTDDMISSVQVDIYCVRNSDLGNPDFFYETEKVQPPSPATPHITYLNRIQLKNGLFADEIFTDKIIASPYKATARFLVNTAEIVDPKVSLPGIPVRLIECESGTRPSVTDGLFNGYSNGHPSFSLTVYNKLNDESELPIFHAETIYKK